jgi:hypothetical protein
MPNIRAALLLFQLTSRRTTRINCFLNSSTASKYRMPVLCIRRTSVSSSDFVAYVYFRPMLNPEKLLQAVATKSVGVCAAQVECDGAVTSIDFLHLLGGMVNWVRKVHLRVNLSPRYRISRLWTRAAEPRWEGFDDCSANFVVGLNLRIEVGNESAVNHEGHESRRGFSETDCLPARPSSWCPRFLS